MKLKIKILIFLFISILFPKAMFGQISGPDFVCGNEKPGYLTRCKISDFGTPMYYVWTLSKIDDPAVIFTYGTGHSPSILVLDLESEPKLTSGRYLLTASPDNSGVCGQKTITIIKVAPPSVSNFNVCEGEIIDPKNKVTGDSIKWYADTASTTPLSIKPISSPGTYKYYVTNVNSGCESSRVPVIFNIFSNPSPTVISSSTICEGDTLNLASKVNGDLIKWYASSTSTAAIAKPATPTKAGNYTYFVTNTKSNCESAKVSFSVTVKEKAVLPTVSNTSICLGTNLDLGTKVSGENLKWYSSTASTIPISKPAVPKTEGKYTYYVTSSNTNCVSPKVPFILNVLKSPTPEFINSTISYCQNEQADSVTKALGAAGEYKWYINATSKTAPASLLPSTKLLGTFTYYVSQIKSGCESERALLKIMVNLTPKIKVTDLILKEESSVDLSGSFLDSNNTNGEATYWKDFNQTKMLSAIEAQSISTPGVYYIKMTSGGCTDSAAIKVSSSNRTNQNIAFSPIVSKTFRDPIFQLGAVASSGLPITYYSSDPSIVNIIGNIVTINAAGTVTITATQEGNETHNPASNVSHKLQIRKAAQTIAVAQVPPRNIGSPSFQVAAITSSGLNLNYKHVNGPASVTSAGSITPSKTTSGVVTIKIIQQGDINYLPVDTTFSFEVLSNVLNNKNFPPKISHNAISGISITGKTVSNIKEVKFFYKKITDNKFDSLLVGPKGKLYSPDLKNKIGEIGLRYYFRIKFDTSLVEYTDTAITYAEYDQGLAIPSLEAGAQTEDYKIISIPLLLDATTVGDVFDELASGDKTKWRLFQYNGQDTSNIELTGSDTIFPGKGYWIISKDPVSINTGKGTAVKVTEIAPFTIKLKKGYNQIGNPYNFPISWDQILNYNSLPVGLDGKVKVFKKTGWQSSTTIQTFEGAYIFAGRDLDINIHAKKIDSLALRSSSLREESNGWLLPLILTDNSGFKTEGAIGMASDASESKDKYDEITLPRFQKFLEINFNHPEYFAPKFSHDVVPESENHIWNLSLESSNKENNLSFQWDASACRNQKEQFYLLDAQTGLVINMKEKAEYRFANTNAKKLTIYYGDESFIQSSLSTFETRILEPFPNPFSESLTLPYFLANSEDLYHVEISLYDVFMKKQLILEEGHKKGGFYSLIWNRETTAHKVAPGLYFIKVLVASNGNQQEWVKKVIVK